MNVVIVTGGSRGIGAKTALKCAKKGFGVILTYKTQEVAAQNIVKDITDSGGFAVALPLDFDDVRVFPLFRERISRILDSKGARLIGLVNNAGYGLYNPIETVSEEEFDGLMNIHLKGPFFLTQSLLPLLKDGASIINLTSATTRVATSGVAPYATFKGGLEVLTRYMAKEFSDRQVRANSVSPGAIKTELGGGLSEEFEKLLASQTSLGRVGNPEEVADIITFLLTEEAHWVNAQNIEVSGGYII